jgi:hypothetical protein
VSHVTRISVLGATIARTGARAIAAWGRLASRSQAWDVERHVKEDCPDARPLVRGWSVGAPRFDDAPLSVGERSPPVLLELA